MTTTHIAGQPLKFGDTDYGPGDTIPDRLIKGMATNAYDSLIRMERLICKTSGESLTPHQERLAAQGKERQRMQRQDRESAQAIMKGEGKPDSNDAREAAGENIAAPPTPSAPSTDEAPSAEYNPSDHKVGPVLTHAQENPDTIPAIVAAETAGKGRTTLIAALVQLEAELAAPTGEDDAEQGEDDSNEEDIEDED
jgi:hypothetical protein